MHKLFHLPATHLPARRSQAIVVTILLLSILVLSALAFAPSAHAAPAAHAVPASSRNACGTLAGYLCVDVWATNVNVRSCASTSCSILGTIAGGHEDVMALCQSQGQRITSGGVTNNWWMSIVADNGFTGYTSNIFIVGGTTIAGIPNC